jgi:predicted ATPase/DNA-binding XRE family transcriptional regulator
VPATSERRQQTSSSAFSRLLKRLRAAADQTQEELAERAGVSTRLISDLERGVVQRPRRDTVQMLADGLRLTGAERDTFVALARRRQGASSTPEPAPTSPALLELPLPPAGFVGREHEIAATTHLLLLPEVRLLTLTGPGGVGKTRLALEAARRVSESFPDGVAFVDLAPVGEAGLVPATMARALGVRDPGGAPAVEQLIVALREARVLVVLDNLEHLVAAGPELAQLLERCSGLTILATSRQPLRLRAEREYPVLPLTLPDLQNLPPLDELGHIPAIDLFLQRAEAVRPTFRLTADNARAVAELAVRLDGLPLAIELAAARVRVLAPGELLGRLERRLPLLTGGARDLPARHQTLRAAIDWSHDLLSPEERRLFRYLAVFSGGFSLQAAEHMAGHEHASKDAPADALEILSSLVDKSLLRAIEPPDGGSEQDLTRFAMLETIREYGLERLQEARETHDARDRHAAWCLDMVDQATPQLMGADQALWFARLTAEHDNVRAALAWTIEIGDAETAQRISGQLVRFWVTEAHLAEGRQWTEQALSLDGGAPDLHRAKALLGAGVLAYFQGDYAGSEAYTTGALEDYQAVGDMTGVASSYGNLGLVADASEDYPLAVERYERALEIFRQLDDRIHISYMLGNLGLIAYFQGDYDRAEPLIEESLALAEERGDRHSVAISLGNLGLVAFARGNYERAATLQREVLLLRKVVTNRSHVAASLDKCAVIAAARQEAERAAQLFGAAAGLRAELGATQQSNDREYNERYIGIAREQLGDEAFTSAWEQGAAMSVEEAVAYALDEALEPSHQAVNAHDD